MSLASASGSARSRGWHSCPARDGIEPASTKTPATPSMMGLHGAIQPGLGQLRVHRCSGTQKAASVVCAVASSSMPASCAITGSISAVLSPEFHIVIGSRTGHGKEFVQRHQDFPRQSSTGAEVTSKVRMPSSVFSAPVRSTLPCSSIRCAARPPQPQTISRLPAVQRPPRHRAAPCRRYPWNRDIHAEMRHLAEETVMRRGADRHAHGQCLRDRSALEPSISSASATTQLSLSA